MVLSDADSLIGFQLSVDLIVGKYNELKNEN